MNDRELLELAAKAYWGDEIDDVCSVQWSEEDQAVAYTHGQNQDHNGRDVTLIWNPLIDDGDALRLAVAIANKCAMALVWQGGTVQFRAQPFDSWINGEDSRDYAESATRRAIVRAAAEIGKAM